MAPCREGNRIFILAGCRLTKQPTCPFKHPGTPFPQVDLKSAHALLRACKNNPVQRVLLDSSNEEVTISVRGGPTQSFTTLYNQSSSLQIDAGSHVVVADAEDVCLSLR